jgi:hypothetical protein
VTSPLLAVTTKAAERTGSDDNHTVCLDRARVVVDEF